EAVASDAATFSSAGGGGRDGGGTLIEDLPSGFAAGVLFNMMDDPRHRRIRRLVTPSVSPRSLAALAADLRRRNAAILDRVAELGEVDFVVEVAAELPLQAIALLLGVPQADRHRLFAWANATLDYDDRDLGHHSEKTLAANREMFEYGRQLLAEKRRQPGDDMLSALLLGRVEGEDGNPEPLTELELQMFFNLLIAAGSETTRNSVAVGLKALAEHPEQWRLLQTDASFLPTAIEEMLRWASSTPYNRRTVTHEMELRGQTIRPGEKVTLWWASANRDEEVFREPFRFDIRRDPNPHLAFGHGSHFCIGANLARLEMRLIFEGLLERFDTVELMGQVEWTRSNKHTGVRHMPVRLVPKPNRCRPVPA
ncbi:MAG TPA: cytochrome P450, partial [Candidatus Acidoferrales bacterium]|nr:cytochrome P450 [Candidatus Acidoferrales bacterium]